jgi:hypothetical protein
MRFRFSTKRNGNKWVVSVEKIGGGGPLIPSRDLLRCENPFGRFPLPPPHAADECDPATHVLCLDGKGQLIATAWEAVNRADVARVDAKRFGRYLAQVLLGKNWAQLQDAAGAKNPAELEILIESDDSDLMSLPWEMIHDDTGPLTALRDRTVAISRVIQPDKVVNAVVEVGLPLRVLFVVGRQIDDVLRPGAELIGLLRTIRVPTDSNFTDFRDTELHVRYLSEATWDEIQSAIAEFHPTIVHLVCHGELDPEGAGTRLLLTAREVDGDPQSRKRAEPYQCSAERLLSLLTDDGSTPPIVIVNACHTAESDQERATLGLQNSSNLSFAATLVRGGVAMALGMSGEVADRSCQLFTLRFYQALLQGSSVSLATAQGRRAAMLGFPDLQDTIDWARPTLFLANGIDPVLRVNRPTRDLGAIGHRFRTLKSPELLCDRYETMQTYEHLQTRALEQQRALLLGFPVKELHSGIGKTRLLEEIAARSVFDSFAPIVIRSQQGSDPPANLLDFAIAVSDAISETREHFQINREVLGAAWRLAYLLAKIDPTPSDAAAFGDQRLRLAKYLQDNRTSGDPAKLPMSSAIGLILEDCTKLQKDIESVMGYSPRLLLLLDDLERYGVVNEIVARAREFGLGSFQLPIALVFTYASSTNAGRRLDEDVLRKRPDIQSFPLDAFTSPVDQRIAFGHYVFSKWKYAINNSRQKREDVDNFYQDMYKFTQGRPGEFSSTAVEAVVRVNHHYKSLIDADFESLLRQWT